MKKPKKKVRQKLKPCPACGDKHLYTVYSYQRRRNKHIECRYCHFSGKPAFTKWGAIRKWNRAKNWRVVK